MGKLILIKRGETDWSKQNRIQGSIDIPLNSSGQKEAQKISAELSGLKIDSVYSGPEACSLSTAKEIASPHKAPVRKIGEFGEFNQGVWQGLLLKEVKKRYKKQYSIWKSSPTSARPPQGESVGDAYDRSISTMHKIVDKHKDQNICIVSGEIILSIMKCHLKNINLEEMWRDMPKKTWWEVIDI